MTTQTEYKVTYRCAFPECTEKTYQTKTAANKNEIWLSPGPQCSQHKNEVMKPTEVFDSN